MSTEFISMCHLHTNITKTNTKNTHKNMSVFMLFFLNLTHTKKGNIALTQIRTVLPRRVLCWQKSKTTRLTDFRHIS